MLRVLKTLVWILSVLAFLIIISFIALAIAHSVIFSRADYDMYDTRVLPVYDDFSGSKYPREQLSITSGESMLAGYLYGLGNDRGLIVISPGHREPSDVKLPEITYFVDAGWTVLCYDYTGCYNSGGGSMRGYSQSVHDLDAVLSFAGADERLNELPVMLFGHSLGGYASAAVLNYGHDVKAAIIASAFDTPKEQWHYSIERYTGAFHTLLSPFTELYIELQYGEEKNLSAIDGINAADIPVLAFNATDDVYYGGDSPVYTKRGLIRNPGCNFISIDAGHYGYFLTEDALEYRKTADAPSYHGPVDKGLYNEHDMALMDRLNQFFLGALE